MFYTTQGQMINSRIVEGFTESVEDRVKKEEEFVKSLMPSKEDLEVSGFFRGSAFSKNTKLTDLTVGNYLALMKLSQKILN
jgi:hypothetical protein